MRNAIATMMKVSLVALLTLALVVLISACGSSSGGSDATSGDNGEVAEHVDDDEHADDEHADDADEHADDADTHEEGGDTVHVSLNEWSITPAHGDAFEASAGDVVFEIHNEGAAPHDFKIVRTDLEAGALPIVDGFVDQEAAGEVIGGSDPLPGDIMVEESYDLEPGEYVLICTIAGHYQQGMYAELTVQ
jgi:uncharacterized cupredoxin-like copper-binding protein